MVKKILFKPKEPVIPKNRITQKTPFIIPIYSLPPRRDSPNSTTPYFTARTKKNTAKKLARVASLIFNTIQAQPSKHRRRNEIPVNSINNLTGKQIETTSSLYIAYLGRFRTRRNSAINPPRKNSTLAANRELWQRVFARPLHCTLEQMSR